MSDDVGRFVLNILAAPLEPLSADVDKVQSYLLDTRFLSATNHSTVATAIIECLVSTGIKFSDVITVNTDNAAYMKKAFNEILKGLMPNATHITCMAHIMSLVGDAFRKPFIPTNKFVKAASAIFWHANARKARYLRFMAPLVKSPKMPPNPIATRWNCWFEAVSYHVKNLQHFATFIAEEMEHCGRMAPDSLVYLNDTLFSESERQLIQAEMSFIIQHSEVIMKATDIFQSQHPIAMTAWSKLMEINDQFSSCHVTLQDVERHCPHDLDQHLKLQLQDSFCQAFTLANEKLEKYTSTEGQPGLKLLKELPFFNPCNLVFVTDIDSLTIPGMHEVPRTEILRYKESLGPREVAASGGIFWNSVSSDLPHLTALAKRYIYTCLNSADAERSFSIYNLVFSERRRRLSEANLKALVFLYYNSVIPYEYIV